MEVSKAIKKTVKSIIKIQFKKSISEIKKSCKQGKYRCKIELVDYRTEHGNNINNKVIEKLKLLGYSLGSTEVTATGDVKNVFWEQKEKQIL
jgi:hypothetical protein